MIYPIGTRCRIKLDDDRGNHPTGVIIEVPRYESGRPRYTITEDQRVVRTGPYSEFTVKLEDIFPL